MIYEDKILGCCRVSFLYQEKNMVSASMSRSKVDRESSSSMSEIKDDRKFPRFTNEVTIFIGSCGIIFAIIEKGSDLVMVWRTHIVRKRPAYCQLKLVYPTDDIGDTINLVYCCCVDNTLFGQPMCILYHRDVIEKRGKFSCL